MNKSFKVFASLAILALLSGTSLQKHNLQDYVLFCYKTMKAQAKIATTFLDTTKVKASDVALFVKTVKGMASGYCQTPKNPGLNIWDNQKKCIAAVQAVSTGIANPDLKVSTDQNTMKTKFLPAVKAIIKDLNGIAQACVNPDPEIQEMEVVLGQEAKGPFPAVVAKGSASDRAKLNSCAQYFLNAVKSIPEFRPKPNEFALDKGQLALFTKYVDGILSEVTGDCASAKRLLWTYQPQCMASILVVKKWILICKSKQNYQGHTAEYDFGQALNSLNDAFAFAGASCRSSRVIFSSSKSK